MDIFQRNEKPHSHQTRMIFTQSGVNNILHRIRFDDKQWLARTAYVKTFPLSDGIIMGPVMFRYFFALGPCVFRECRFGPASPGQNLRDQSPQESFVLHIGEDLGA